MKTLLRVGRSRMRGAAAVVAVTLAVGMLQVVGAASATETEVPEPETETEAAPPAAGAVRVVSYNASARTTVRQNEQDVAALAEQGADIIALQEMSSWKKRQKIRAEFVDCEECSYDGWIPIRAVPGGLPILYRSDRFRLVKQGMRQITSDTYVGPRGAGPRVMKARYVVYVKLRDTVENRTLWVLNTHGIPTVQRGNGRPNWKLRKRVRLYRQHMAGVRRFVAEIGSNAGGVAIVTGDLNVNYRTDRVVAPKVFPYHQLGRVRTVASHEQLGLPATGTHVLRNGFDKRLIDYVYLMRRRWVAPVQQEIVFGLNSDHRPMLVDLEVYSKDCFEMRRNLCTEAE